MIRIKLPKKLSKQRLLLLSLGLVLVGGGIYGLMLTYAPTLPVIKAQPFSQQQIDSIDKTGDKVIIPKIGVNINFGSGGEDMLEKGAWWRYPERGNPVDGGNFILSAHRFSLGLTPGQTRTKSPFYHIDKLSVGDSILIDYKGKRYDYKIARKYRVEPTRTDIEAKTEDNKLTLYSCTLKGAQDGRDVVEAKLAN